MIDRRVTAADGGPAAILQRRVVTVVATAALVVLAACGAGEPGAERSDDGRAPVEPAEEGSTTTVGAPECPPPEATIPGYDGLLECELPDVVYDDDAHPGDRVKALAESAREAGQLGIAAALEDGDVTVAEHRQAYQDALDCMTAEGMEVFQFEEYEGLYGTDFTFIVGWGLLSEAEAEVASTTCESQYTFAVGQAVDILAGDRFTERAKQIIQDCMVEHGVTDDVGDTVDELREVSPNEEVTTTCTSRAEQKPPLPPGLPTSPGG